MAYLNGSAIPDLLSGRTLIVKYLGTLAGITSNVAMGPEAPMVHLGASVAHVVTHAVCGASHLLQSGLVVRGSNATKVSSIMTSSLHRFLDLQRPGSVKPLCKFSDDGLSSFNILGPLPACRHAYHLVFIDWAVGTSAL